MKKTCPTPSENECAFYRRDGEEGISARVGDGLNTTITAAETAHIAGELQGEAAQGRGALLLADGRRAIREEAA